MSASSTVPGAPWNASTNSKHVSIASIFVFAALIMGGLGVVRLFSVFSNNWVFQKTERIAVVASVLTPCFLTCVLFLVAAWLLYSPPKQPITGSRTLSTIATLTALYGPFYWALNSLWWHLLPVLPGFTAGVFAKSLDNRLVFVAASCTLTVFLLISLRTIRDRLRHGQLAAPVIGLVISSLTSYAAYSFMRA